MIISDRLARVPLQAWTVNRSYGRVTYPGLDPLKTQGRTDSESIGHPCLLAISSELQHGRSLGRALLQPGAGLE